MFELGGPLAFALILGMQLYDQATTEHGTERAQSIPETVLLQNLPVDTSVFPVSGYDASAIISGFGDPRGKSRKHLGVDIKAPRHTPVVAIRAGKIEGVQESSNGGKTIYLRGDDNLLYFYAHLESRNVKKDEVVTQGQVIATVGDSGNAKGTTPHLHFEVMTGKGKERKSIDPASLLIGL